MIAHADNNSLFYSYSEEQGVKYFSRFQCSGTRKNSETLQLESLRDNWNVLPSGFVMQMFNAVGEDLQ